jgi:hypothetical protein
VTFPADPEVGLAKQVVWLPEGEWFNFFTGEHITGGAWHGLYMSLEEIPVFARPGAIVPLAAGAQWMALATRPNWKSPSFPVSRRFELFEDDGESNAYRQGTTASRLSCKNGMRTACSSRSSPYRVSSPPALRNATFTLLFQRYRLSRAGRS